MSAEAIIVVTPTTGVVEVSSADKARQERDALLASARGITAVTDRFDADCAITVQRDLKAFADLIEAGRVSVKAPYLEATRKIDALAKELAADVETEQRRLGRIVGTFELEEKRRADDERRKAEAEAARIAAEAAEKAAAAAQKEKTVEAKERAADNVFAAAQTKIVEVKQAAANVVAPRPSGVRVIQKPKFEVTDISALYKAHPEYCKLSTNDAAILAVMRANPNIQIPGLRTWWEAGASV